MRLVSLFLLVSASACDSAADPAPTFGDDYRVLAEPAPPTAQGGQVTATVEYSGGCAEHDFVLRSRETSDGIEVWFVHDGRGDACEAAITETLTATLPGVAADAPALWLLQPVGEPVSLR